MNTAIINFTTDPKLKKEAQKVAKKLGIPLSLALNNYLKEFVATKTVTFRDETPSQYLIDSIKQSEEDIKAGRVIFFNSGKEALKYLDEMIKKEEDDTKSEN